jgi:hypothetical protein
MAWRLEGSKAPREREVASLLQQQLVDLAEADELAGSHPPFAGRRIAVVLPELGRASDLDERSRAGIRGMRALLEQNRVMLEAELGGAFFFAPADPGGGPRWLIGPGSTRACRASGSRLPRAPSCASIEGVSCSSRTRPRSPGSSRRSHSCATCAAARAMC